MKKGLTELVFILDESGSMGHLRDDTIGGFNTMLEDQRGKDGEVLVTTYLFSDSSRMIHDRVPVNEVKELTAKDYVPHGCTALLDAMGRAIRHIVGIHRYAREEDIPENTIFVITTDGMENASRRFSAEKIREMVSHEQEKYGWEFIYLAANIDAVETAGRYGIRADSAVDYCPDAQGTEKLFESVNCAIHAKRCGADLKKSRAWREDIDADFANRGK